MTIALRTAGAWAAGSTAPAPTIPTSQEGDILLLYVGCKPFSATINTPAGWQAVFGTAGTNGSVANGVDTGSVRWAAFWRPYTTGLANPAISVTSGNVSLAVIKSFSKTTGAWEDPTGCLGSDTTSGTGFSLATTSNPGIKLDDMLCTFATIAGNNATFGTPTLTATGATIGAPTESPATEGTTTTGNDLESSSSHALCTAGTATANPVIGWTLSVAQTGGGCLVRLRERVDTAQKGAYAGIRRGGGIDPNLPLGLRGNIGRPGPGKPGITRLRTPDQYTGEGVFEGAPSVTGTVNVTNANDTVSAAGSPTVTGTLSRTNANDASAASGTTTVVGSLARTNADDTCAASGVVGSVSGTLAYTNENDTSAASGTTTVTGSLSRTNANDTSAASGTTTVLGTLATTNADDSCAASGSVGSAVSGSLAYTNADDTSEASGFVTVAQQDVTGGWPILYIPGRKRRVDIPEETTAEVTARLIAAQQLLRDRIALRKAEQRSQELTQKIREAFAEKDALEVEVLAAELAEQLRLDDEELLELLPILASVH